jgi:hypothetical protein
MGKTVPSYRMAQEDEIARWKPFLKALKTAEDKEAFAVMMDMCRNNAMASGAACKPVIFEPMVMSIALAHQKQLSELEFKMNDLIWQKVISQDSNQNVDGKEIKRSAPKE